MRYLRIFLLTILILSSAVTALAAESDESASGNHAETTEATDNSSQAKITDRIEEVVRQVDEGRGQETIVTSRERSDSAAHREGRAIDVAGTDPSRAHEIAQRLGPGHRVIVEVVNGDGTQTDTKFEEGRPGHYGPAPYDVETKKQTAKGQYTRGDHTHVQQGGPGIPSAKSGKSKSGKSKSGKRKDKSQSREGRGLERIDKPGQTDLSREWVSRVA